MVRTCNRVSNNRAEVGPLGLISTGRSRPIRRRRSMKRASFGLILAVIFLLTGTVALARRNGNMKASFPSQVTVTVQSGDTLWKIAHRYGNPNRYILERVDELANENDISADAVLLPGQHVVVPVSSEQEYQRIIAKI